MQISVILVLEEVGTATGVAGGWLDMVIATGDGVLLWQKRMRGQARPFVKDTAALLPYHNRTFFNSTWTGDTHKETDVLPSTKQSEDGGDR